MTVLVTALTVTLPVAGSSREAVRADEEITAATEAAAIELAAEHDQRVEVTGLREERRTVYAEPDGSFTAREYANPVRVLRDGEWIDPDATLVRHADGTIAPEAASIGLALSPGGDAPLAVLTRAGKEMSLAWPEPLPEPELEGNEALYPSVAEDVDLIVRAETDGFSHVLVVHTPEAAESAELSELRLSTQVDGVELVEDEEGLAAVDSGVGGAVFEAAEPLMWDSGGMGGDGETVAPQSRSAQEPLVRPDAEGDRLEEGPSESSRIAPVEVHLEGEDLVLHPDQEMLSAEETAYPLYIDPVWKTSTRTAWAMVASGYSGTSFWKFSGQEHEGAGRCPQLAGDPYGCNGVGVKRLLYRMPTGAYADKQILSAELAVTLRHTYDSGSHPVRAYRTGGFGTSTNWSNQPSWVRHQDTQRPSNPTSSCTLTNQNVRFDVSDAVSDAASNGWSTTSFGLRAGDESTYTQWKRFCDNAHLEVRYNTVPDIPDQAWMGMDPGGACVYGDDRPYVDEPPRLSAYLSDGDEFSDAGEKLQGQFRVFWTDEHGEEQEHTYTTPEKVSGSFFHYQVPDDIPENTTIAWIVRAYDGYAWGPWSWSGSQTRCQFVYNPTGPEAPEVSSEDFPADDDWHDGVGVYGDFTIQSSSEDVIEYRYGINEDPSAANTLTPDSDGKATLTVSPWFEGPHSLYVEAVDRSGKTSARASHLFLVEGGRPAVGHWSMADDPGSEGAADTSGADHTALAGDGATFGEEGPSGASGSAVVLDGSEGAYLAPGTHLVDTTSLFSAAAWVRLDELDSDQAVLSQDGSGGPGFTLGYDASDQAWHLAFPDPETHTPEEWSVSADTPVIAGEWTHLAMAHDSHANTARLYVNGSPEGTIDRDEAPHTTGDVQIGRALSDSGYHHHLNGALADVRVFDRLVHGYEFDRLRMLPVDRRGYWPFNDLAEDGTSPDAEGLSPMVLNGGANIYTADPWQGDSALIGQGHLQLNGDGDSAGALVDEPLNGSFTITARTRLAAAEPDETMTVLSQNAYNSLIDLRYNAESGRWEAVLSNWDSNEADTTVLEANDVSPSSEMRGDHLALVFDAFAQEVRFYVNGTRASTRAFHPLWPTPEALDEDEYSPWPLLNVGRAMDGHDWHQHFSGAVDDVRVYSGAADDDLISALNRTTENPEL
ncbi:LamG-like jellyroll fold domain-containing protein [Nocardiopsis valliformis]|uniref:LamG-like jellyroll fold domain-containing protein n=1 Tax=Nocardiopsis valliformis TaxID=239974 RepID=UPI000348193E|nr:LamG-like jellyroll fold domain-containing protein [Nocardiopsis valliformis]